MLNSARIVGENLPHEQIAHMLFFRAYGLPEYCWRTRATALRSAGDRLPTRRTMRSLCSVVILTGRTTDGAGKPARSRSWITTSLGQERFSALVIITSQWRAC